MQLDWFLTLIPTEFRLINNHKQQISIMKSLKYATTQREYRIFPQKRGWGRAVDESL